MSTPVFILGAGGHARDIADIADAVGYRPVFVTRDRALIAGWAGGDREIAHEDEAIAHPREDFVLGIGDNRTRAAVAARLEHLSFRTLIHPETSFGRGSRAAVESSPGTVVFAGVRMTNNLRIGKFCTINLGATLSHDVELGDFANISPGAHVAGNVRIGEGAWIGIGVAINQGTDNVKLEIGAWTTVGSGAVVVNSCDANATYVGVPARKIK
jgi:sugar O-acyltransferase (sialic acid O-acetyltransferase NeuD family)